MTLSSEIAALTGNEDAATLRAIDARVAALLGLVPADATLKDDFEPGSFYSISKSRDLTLWTAPTFTTSLDATLAEIRRLGATTALTLEDRHSLRWKWEIRTSGAKRVSVWGNSASLAALEALVLAVEGQG